MEENEPASPADNEHPETGSEEQAPETPAIPLVEPYHEEAVQEKPPESRMGRLARIALRWLVLAAVLFAVGFFTAYFALYRPAVNVAYQLSSEVSQTRGQLSTAQANLQDAQGQSAALKDQYDQAKINQDKAQNHLYLQMVLTDTANARLALANKDGPAAHTALTSAQGHLEKLIPAAEQQDGPAADALSTRLSLILNELNRDPQTAIADLDVLTKNLQELEKAMFKD
jgi:hypothetical protein